MKKALVVTALLLGGMMFGRQSALTESQQLNIGFYSVHVMDDTTAGTRCYIVVSTIPRRDGPTSAISCVPKR